MRASEIKDTGTRFLLKEKGQFMDIFYYTLIDAVTGVNYLLTQDIYNEMVSESIIVLVDAVGKPIVSSDDEIQTLRDEGADYTYKNSILD